MSRLNREARDFATPRNYVRLLNSVPAKKRKEIGAEHGYDFNARKLEFDPHLRAWVLFELTEDETLRDMHAAVNGDPLYRLNGAGIDISIGGLSHAHATRPYEALQDVLMEALARIEKVPKSKRVLRALPPATLRQVADLLNQAVLFDSTTLHLPSKIKEWAEQHTGGDLPLKVHLRLHGGYGGIDRLILTAEHENDALRYKELLDLDQAQEAGYIYLHDCGYRDLDTYDDIWESGNHFVSRFHSQITVHHVRDLALPEELHLSNGYTLIHDRIVTLGAREDHEQHPYRLINILDTKGKPIVIVTSLLDLPVEHVCLLYFYRWTIEIVKPQIDNRWPDSDDVMDHYFSAGNDDLVNDELDYTATLFEGGCLQPCPGHFTKVLDFLNHHLLTESLFLLTTQILDLPFPSLNFLLCSSPTGGQLIQLDNLCLIRIDEATDLTMLLANQTFQPFDLLAQRSLSGQSLTLHIELLYDQIGILQQFDDLVPHHGVKPVSANTPSGALLCSPRIQRRMPLVTIVIGVFLLLHNSVHCHTAATFDQPAKKVLIACVPWGVPLIAFQLFLSTFIGFLIDDGWNGNWDPLLSRTQAVRAFLLLGIDGWISPFLRFDRHPAIVVGRSSIGLVGENPSYTGLVPASRPPRRDLHLIEPFGDLAGGDTILYQPVKHLAHDFSFACLDLRPARLSILSTNVSVTIGSSGPNQHLTGACLAHLSTAHPLCDLCTFVLCKHALHLQEKLVLGFVTDRTLEKLKLTSTALQVGLDHLLPDIVPSQTIRMIDHHDIELTVSRGVSQSVQARTGQASAAVAVIQVDVPFLQNPILIIDILAQGLDLGLNGLLHFLTCSRYPRIDCNSLIHCPPPVALLARSRRWAETVPPMDCRDAAYQAQREDETLSGCVFRHPAPVFAESELATECPLPTSWSSTGCFSSMPSMPQEVDESTNNLSLPTPWQDKHLGRHREPKLPICDCTIELIFRFLKRSLNGLHLLSHSKEGVTIHFYALLITALLELRLKQQCIDCYEALASATASLSSETDPPVIVGLMIDPGRLAGARGNTFLATVGEKLHRYWKISKHWLVTLRNCLAQPFDYYVVTALGRL